MNTIKYLLSILALLSVAYCADDAILESVLFKSATDGFDIAYKIKAGGAKTKNVKKGVSFAEVDEIKADVVIDKADGLKITLAGKTPVTFILDFSTGDYVATAKGSKPVIYVPKLTTITWNEKTKDYDFQYELSDVKKTKVDVKKVKAGTKGDKVLVVEDVKDKPTEIKVTFDKATSFTLDLAKGDYVGTAGSLVITKVPDPTPKSPDSTPSTPAKGATKGDVEEPEKKENAGSGINYTYVAIGTGVAVAGAGGAYYMGMFDSAPAAGAAPAAPKPASNLPKKAARGGKSKIASEEQPLLKPLAADSSSVAVITGAALLAFLAL